MLQKRRLTALAVLGLILAIGSRVQAGPIIYAMAGGGNGHFYGVDIGANTTTLIGTMPNGAGWSTVGETPDGTLFFMQRFLADVHIYSVASNNIQVVGGIISNLQDRGTTSLGGNLDGLVNGPDGNLYISAYDNSNAGAGPRNGLYRYDPNTSTTEFVGTFAGDAGPGGVNSFYTDLAFDPITGDLIGTGTNSVGLFIPYRIGASQVLTGTNHVFTYVDAFPSWDGNLFDGLAYDPTTGELYASGDAGGVYKLDRTTGAIIQNIGNNAGTDVGTDLAMQTSPNVGAPEPASIGLLGIGGLALLGYARRRRQRA